MIETHLYGQLRFLVSGSRADEDTILMCKHRPDETFEAFLGRLDLEPDIVGDCFINGVVAKPSDVLADGDRVGLFPLNMALMDGGMHLKFHPHRR
jgi:hypothetical protein